jgi:hypothetical protein
MPCSKTHRGRLHTVAVEWLKDRANPEEEGGMGVFADTRFCLDLTRLLQRVEKAALAGKLMSVKPLKEEPGWVVRSSRTSSMMSRARTGISGGKHRGEARTR